MTLAYEWLNPFIFAVVLVALGDQLGISVGDLFIGSVIPGLMMAGSFVIHVLIVAFLKPNVAPALPAKVREIGGNASRKRVVQVMLPPLILILWVYEKYLN